MPDGMPGGMLASMPLGMLDDNPTRGSMYFRWLFPLLPRVTTLRHDTIARMKPTVVASVALAALLALAGCSSSHKASGTSHGTTGHTSADTRPTIAVSGLDPSKIPSCQSLVGKPLPASVADSGCIENNNIRAVGTYTCRDGSALVALPGEQNQTYYWAPAGKPVRSGSWQVGNEAAINC